MVELKVKIMAERGRGKDSFSSLGPAYGCLAPLSLLILIFLLFLKSTVILIKEIHVGFILSGLVRTWKPKSEISTNKVIKQCIFGISWPTEEYIALSGEVQNLTHFSVHGTHSTGGQQAASGVDCISLYLRPIWC